MRLTYSSYSRVNNTARTILTSTRLTKQKYEKASKEQKGQSSQGSNHVLFVRNNFINNMKLQGGGERSLRQRKTANKMLLQLA